MTCTGRERCCPGRRQRLPRFFDRDWPEKSASIVDVIIIIIVNYVQLTVKFS